MPSVTLRELTPSDEPHFLKWWNDQELRALTSGAREPLTPGQVAGYFRDMLDSLTARHFMIDVDGLTIGHLSLSERDDGWHETQVVIGEREHWGKGYGSDAIAQLVNRAKGAGIAKIYLEVRPENSRAIAAYRKCGFVEDGVIGHDSADLPETRRMVWVGVTVD